MSSELEEVLAYVESIIAMLKGSFVDRDVAVQYNAEIARWEALAEKIRRHQ